MKLSHQSVNYGPGHKNGDHCSICRHYIKPHCRIVADPIEPMGWCEKFSKKSAIAKHLMGRGLISRKAYANARG